MDTLSFHCSSGDCLCRRGAETAGRLNYLQWQFRQSGGLHNDIFIEQLSQWFTSCEFLKSAMWCRLQ
jgi:hypothetical protein